MERKFIDANAYIQDKKHVTLKEIKRIFEAAGKNDAVVHFGQGRYFLREWECHKTISIAHDDGCGDIDEKDCHLYLEDFRNLTLEGECTETGEPATVLVGFNSQMSQTLLPSILWMEGCGNLTVRNLAFTREPECASAGEIVKIEGNCIFVKVFPDNPCYDGMAAYCMNRFSLPDRKLLGESLTYGYGYDKCFKLIGERLLKLEDSELSMRVHVGEGLSWHQAGKTDFQIFFSKCDNLKLENIRIYNTNSYAILTENCSGILAERLVIRPKGNQFFTGPRDGWKIYRCTGEIHIKNCITEGVRMDGQNVHSNFLIVKERLSKKEFLADCRYAPISMRRHFQMELYGEKEKVTTAVKDWEIVETFFEKPEIESREGASVKMKASHQVTRYKIQLEEEIPLFVKEGTLLVAKCWEPCHYLCENSHYRNIAGAAHLLRCKNVEIKHCVYENMMNAGVLIGAEFDTHCEGGHGENIKIEQCIFRGCGTKARYGSYGKGCIAIKSQGFFAPVNKNIVIRENIFEDSERALEIRDAENVEISGNQYKNVKEKIFLDRETTERINICREGKEEII